MKGTKRGSLSNSIYGIEDKVYQLNEDLNKFHTLISQIDFIQPVKTEKFEARSKNTNRQMDNDQVISSLDSTGLNYFENPLKTDHLSITK